MIYKTAIMYLLKMLIIQPPKWWLSIACRSGELVLILIYSAWILHNLPNYNLWFIVFTELIAVFRASLKLIPSILIDLISYHEQTQCHVQIIDISGERAIADLVSFEIIEIFESTQMTFEAQHTALYKTKAVCNEFGIDYQIFTAKDGTVQMRLCSKIGNETPPRLLGYVDRFVIDL